MRSRPLNLGVYVPVFERRPAGMGTYVSQMCSRLAERARTAALFTTTPDLVPDELRSRFTVHGLGFGPRRHSTLQRSIWANSQLPLALSRIGIDVLFVPLHEAPLLCRTPFVPVIHDLTPLRQPSAYFSPLMAPYLRHILPRIIRRSRLTVAVSESTRSDLVSLLGANGTRIAVASEGYDEFVYRPRTSVERADTLSRLGVSGDFMFYSGTCAAHKNVAFLASVLRGVRDEGVEMTLLLAGRQDVGDIAGVRRRFEELGVWDSVREVGYLTRPELSCLMSAASAFVFPSLYEGFGLAPLEAMASGGAVLSSNRASLPEVVGSGGVLLDPDDAAAWVREVKRLQREPDWAAELRQRGIEQASRFSWDRAADDVWSHLTAAAG